ncbi:MAG TPA: HEAT repeat domain-containing protein [Polyangia bacterium]|jgi:HEAT repeat protein
MPPLRSAPPRRHSPAARVLATFGGLALVAALPGFLPAATPVRLADTADGSVELRQDATVLARVAVQTPPLRRGTPQFQELTVAGHPVAELRIPVRGRAAEEVWIGDLAAHPVRVIWSGFTGARDVDGEASLFVEVTPDRIFEYQTASQVSRCDGQPVRLFPRAWDFASARFRPIVSTPPAPAAQKLTARRGDPTMPIGHALGGFHFISASTTSGAGADARGLAAPTALDDGDPRTVWAEGLGGDGRGEFLTARTTTGPAHVLGLRIVPGDASSPAAFKAHNRLKSLSLAFGPEPERRFEVDFAQDPAATSPDKLGAPFWIALPAPVDTACVTVVIRDVYRGAEKVPAGSGGTTAISDLEVFTDLDGAAGMTRLIADTATGVDCGSRVPLLAGLGEPAVTPLAQAMTTATGAGRACLVQALARIDATARSTDALDALVGALMGATPREERLIADTFMKAPQPPVIPLAGILGAKTASDDDRGRAARVLGTLPGEAATAALVAAMGVGSPAVRLDTAQALGHSPGATVALVASAIEATRAHPPLTPNRLGDLIRVLPALARRSPTETDAAHKVLQQALTGATEFDVRARIIMALGALPSGDVTADLTPLAAGSDDAVLRYLAVRELASPALVGALPTLRQALGDPDPRVRETAAEGLGARKDVASESLLIAGAKQEDWPLVRRAEIEALGRLCGEAGRELLMRAIERDVDDVRRVALVGLTRCHDKRAPGVLLQVVKAHPLDGALRELAASLIGEAGHSGTMNTLADLLPGLVNEAESDLAIEGVVVATLRALAHRGNSHAVPAIATLTRDTRHPYRQIAVETLGQICDPNEGARALAAVRTGADRALAEDAAAAEAHCQATATAAKPAGAAPPAP